MDAGRLRAGRAHASAKFALLWLQRRLLVEAVHIGNRKVKAKRPNTIASQHHAQHRHEQSLDRARDRGNTLHCRRSGSNMVPRDWRQPSKVLLKYLQLIELDLVLDRIVHLLVARGT